MVGRYGWKEVDTGGDRWKVGDSVMFFIYITVFTVSLASKKDRPQLLPIQPPLGAICVPYFHFIN